MIATTDVPTVTVAFNVLYLLSRYLHIISAMLLVGGILFYEMVVPVAISDLKEETQVAIFARARWVFRWVIWTSAAMLFITGAHVTLHRMPIYIQSEFISMPTGIHDPYFAYVPWTLKTGWWWAAHLCSALFAILIALHLGAGDRPPVHPLGWLRMDLMVLLIVVFFAVVTRHLDQMHLERRAALEASGWQAMPIPPRPAGDRAAEPTTEPTTAPSTQASGTP